MAVYRNNYVDPKTGKRKQADVWWYDFIYAGKRIRESAQTTRKGLAKEAEKRRRLELERAQTGAPVDKPGDRQAVVLPLAEGTQAARAQERRAGAITGTGTKSARCRGPKPFTQR